MSFEVKSWICASLKGQCHEIFDFRFFFLNQFPTSPWVSHYGRLEFFQKFAEIFAAQGAPSVFIDSSGKEKIFKLKSFNYFLFTLSIVELKGGFFGFFLFVYVSQTCFICRPSDSTLSEDARIEPRTVATLSLTARRSNHLARSHP